MKYKNNQEAPCPCGSGSAYSDCCRPFHQGELPDTALQLMRSRYSAYAFCIPEYIIHTTDPASPQFNCDINQWTQQISEFCLNTEFKNLEILNFQEEGRFASVTFVAHLTQNKKDMSFTERSYFQKTKGKWLYRIGKLFEGLAPNAITTHPLRPLPLAYYGHPILRQMAGPVVRVTDDLCKLIEQMIETMDIYDGVGLAAPQIHHSIKLFVIRKPVEIEGGKIELKEVKVFINPELSMPSTEVWKASEGCVSIPSIYAEVERPQAITVEYSDLQGNRIKERVSGWEARIIMHENDHICGILFIDHLEEEEKQRLAPFLQHLENRIHERN